MVASVATLLYAVIVLVVVQKLVIWLYKYVQCLKLARKVTGFPGTRLIEGDIWQIRSFNDYFRITMDLVQTVRPKMHVVWIGFIYPRFIIDHPDAAKVLLKATSVPKTNDASSAYTMLKPWIGDGLIASIGGKTWERKRRLLTPAFHFDILKNYVIVFNDVAEEFLIQLSQCRDKSIEICAPVHVATLDALLRCAFSYDGNIQGMGHDHKYVAAMNELSNVIMTRICNPLLYPDFIFTRTRVGKRFQSRCDYVHAFADDIIAGRKQILETDGEHEEKRHRDFLDILLLARDEQGQGLSDADIRAEVDTFLFAGHETTSSSIGFAIYSLATNPDVQERIYKEVMEVAGNRSDLPKLKYMLCFIKEVIRMYSIVPQISRGLIEPLTIEGVTFPAGTLIDVCIQSINHHPDVWPDHQEFRPERFEEDTSDRDPFCYIPFSAGSRNCIGQAFALHQMKVVIARLVQVYYVELDKSHKVEFERLLLMKTKTGIKVHLKPR